MLEIPKLGDEDSGYDGSRTFTWLADICGLSVDLVNFLLSQVLALFLASLFRTVLHPAKVSLAIRHAFGPIVGLLMGYFCFGQQAVHIAGLPAVCYIIIRTQNPQIMQRIVLCVSMIYLSCIHIHRLYYDYGSSALDITGPLMVITQKVTSLAFSIHDGLSRNENELTKSQQYHAVRKLPSALEYFSYVLNFQGLMAGPLVFYTDYMEFIEGSHLLRQAPGSNEIDNDLSGKEIIIEPSPTKVVVKKVIGSLVCAFIFMKFIKIYPIKIIKDADFLSNTSIFYKFWFLTMSTTMIRFKYYHAWLLSDAICNNSGLGFNGYDNDGNAKWDMISNINVISFEFATNFRDAINNWNLGTNRWLRNIVYERVPKKYGTVLTFSLSALWHGFYPGYYITFATGALITMAARMSRKLFRHHFQDSEFKRLFYDVLTIFTTRVFMCYATFPFVVLEYKASIQMYLRTFMCLHLVAVITIYVLPIFLQVEKVSSDKNVKRSSPLTTSNSSITHPLLSTTSTPLKTNNNLTRINSTDTKIVNGSAGHRSPADDKDVDMASNCDNNIKFSFSINKTIETNNQNNGSNHPTANRNVQNINNNKNNKNMNGGGRRQRLNEDHFVNNDKENLSFMIREKIDSETRNLEVFLDKTVTGIVELKDDLMKVSENERFITENGTSNGTIVTGDEGGLRHRKLPNNENVEHFLKKEIESINSVVQSQVNVLPAVLSNGHAK